MDWRRWRKGKAIGAKTERERDWLAAIELYYKDYDKVDQTTRGLAYEKAMEGLMQKYPDDPEAAIFYALALNETALPSDKTYANQLKAGAILEKVLVSQPDHPGALHYLIHSYDYPPLAQRALAAANKYAGIAPAAPHAQHMPAHTYSMLGLWAQSVESNTKSRKPLRSKRPDFGRGRPHPGVPHLPGFYGVRPPANGAGAAGETGPRRQQRHQEARVRKHGVVIPVSLRFRRASRSSAKRGKKPPRLNREAASSRKPRPSPISPAPWAPRAAGISRPQIRRSISLRNCALRWKRRTSRIGPTQVEIQMLAASAWIAHAKGQKDEALKFMRAAADLEDNSAKHIAMENRLYPMRELLGDLLLEQRQPSAALTEYETSLQSTPNRLRGLYGAAKAAEGAEQLEKATIYFRKLVELTKDADTDRVEIREAKAFLTPR